MRTVSAFFLFFLLGSSVLEAQALTPMMSQLMDEKAEDELVILHAEEQKRLQLMVVHLLWNPAKADWDTLNSELTRLSEQQKLLAEQEVLYPASAVKRLQDKHRPAKLSAYAEIQQWCKTHPEQAACVELLQSSLPKDMPSEEARLAMRDNVAALVAETLSLVVQTQELLARVIDKPSADAHAAALAALFRASQELDIKISAIDSQWFTSEDLQHISQASAYACAYSKMLDDLKRIDESACFNSKPLEELFIQLGIRKSGTAPNLP